MDERVVYAATLAFLLVSTAAVGLLGGQGHPAPEQPEVSDDEYQVTDQGVRYTVHPSNLRQGCPAGRDCIPSIEDPQFQTVDQADWLKDEDLVIGLEVDGETKAYPLRILNVHEIVNDRIAGEPVAVTYCPLCRSGLVFSRDVANTTVTFGVSGKLWNANLVMYDRQTGTYWSQIRAEAVVGPLVPETLDQVPSTITTWEQWREAHPQTKVLSRNTGIYPPGSYGSNPYASYAESDRVGFGVENVDDRLGTKDVVYGVTVGNESVAYPEIVVEDRRIIDDQVDNLPILVVQDPGDGSVDVFVREVGNETLEFSMQDGRLVDQHGHEWGFDGTAREGPNEGQSMDRIDTHGFYWFAWSSFNPQTEVYGLESVSDDSDDADRNEAGGVFFQ